jgi:hypothetical protein
MAFVNEKLTPKQREEFSKRGLKNPLCSKQDFIPYFWTADHNQNAYLIDAGAYHDIPEENLFIFIYDSGVFLFTIEMLDIDDVTKAWEFKKCVVLSSSQKIDEEKLMLTFEEALLEYKYNGLPNKYNQQFKMKINF